MKKDGSHSGISLKTQPRTRARSSPDQIVEAAGFDQDQNPVADRRALICLSHLRWDFVYQRPQHLMTRSARADRVFFVEEPIFGEDGRARLEVSERAGGICVVVPHLPNNLREKEIAATEQRLLDELFVEHKIGEHLLWYYTPMALDFTRHLKPRCVIYDCMDELSLFKGAPPALKEREAELFAEADLVFTGGQSLYEAKRELHPRVYAFPSSIDAAHFAQARTLTEDPADQAGIPHPRLGFCGVLDERMDLELLSGIACTRPDWHLVMIGPIVKINPADLPQRPNIHYLGPKSYKNLPAYLAGWEVALLPFARNNSTRFISPTKTPEYLAAGRPVVSTSIRDVVRPYGKQKLVHIADTTDEFVRSIESAMNEDAAERVRRVDAFLAETSWDLTWQRMDELIEGVIDARRTTLATNTRPTVLQRPATLAVTGGIDRAGNLVA
ncbi:MAG: glycosyltransferase family 1 protein [Pyrinomonadaceae bacterium]|nr:glycosyltransferase family 1 protein [Pyrinomonadaceae bacterium]